MSEIPAPDLRAVSVLRELYAGLEAERVASAYTLVTETAERRVNALIGGWLDQAYNQGLIDAQEAVQRAREADVRDFEAAAKKATHVIEVAGSALGARSKAHDEGGRCDYPGGPCPPW